MQVKKAMDTLEPGEQVEIVATDAGFARDASARCDTTGNRLVGSHEDKGRYTVVIEKGNSNMVCPSSTGTVAAGRGKTLILFSDDLDKALATFVLANGAAATGQKVTVFFTFWGLNVLKKVQETESKERYFRQDVRYDASFQFFETEIVSDEYVRCGKSHDALFNEA